MRYLLNIITTLILLGSSLFAQFGQNRVQYKDHEWFFIQTKHFDVYFTQDGDKIAEFTAHAAEEALEQIQDDLKYQVNNRISLIVYDSHNDFQETTTTDGYLSQGVGGFTEPFKNRVVFPFEGDYQKFRHVIHHELVHAVMRDLLYGGTVQNIIAKGITLQLPIWYHEGMAEFLSSGWETNSDMFIRDAIINEYLPDINQLNGYFAYRGGQSLFYYISKTYGRNKVGEMLNKIKGLGSVTAGIKSSIGLELDELNERWKKDLKVEYWPEIATRKDPDDIAKRLTDNKEAGGFYNTSPAISPQGDKIVFISDRDIFLDVYLMNSYDGEIIDEIIESGRTNDFEELNVLFPSLTWAPDNKRIALSRKSAGYDRIYIYDTEEEEGSELPFKLDGIESVSWSPDGNWIALSGADSKQSDIYIYNLNTEELIDITADIFSDKSPTWSPDGRKIFFSSDRGKYTDPSNLPEEFAMYKHDFDNMDLYFIDVESKKIERITDWELSDESSVVISPSGDEILFTSDFNGITNIYKKSLKFDGNGVSQSYTDIKAIPVTNSLNGINQLSLSADGKKLVFTSLFKGGYNIFLMNNPFELEAAADTLEFTGYMASLHNGGYSDSELFAEAISNDQDSLDIPEFEPIKLDTVSRKISVSDSTEKKTKIFTGQYKAKEEESNDSTRVDVSNYVFGGTEVLKDTSDQSLDREKIFQENLDDDGNYLVNRYKINFSPDLIYANAGYSTLYGLLGTTVLTFSDVLGGHRIIGVTSLQIDLKNSDYGLAYYYLKQRINYGIEGFHTARFVYLSNGFRSELYRYRNFGGVLSASLPLSRFYRLDASVSLLNVSSENLDNLSVPSDKSTFIIPSLSFVKDNTMFGYTAPIEGSRYKLTVFGDPGLNNSRQSFYSLVWDYRTYFRFWFDNSFAFRLSGGYSGGGNPQRFFIGGTESWINRRFASGDIPIESPSDFAFLTPALPMRGFDYAEKIGTRYALANFELRVPVIRYLVTGPLPLLFSNILGTAFLDVGTAWNDNDKLQLFHKNETGSTATKDLLIGTGYGFRMYFIFLWRFDVAWSYDLDSFSGPKYYFSIGLDF